MYGRGAFDMKSGIAINLFLARLLHDLGIWLSGDLIVQSVIEEECTGVGSLDMSAAATGPTRRWSPSRSAAASPGRTSACSGSAWRRRARRRTR